MSCCSGAGPKSRPKHQCQSPALHQYFEEQIKLTKEETKKLQQNVMGTLSMIGDPEALKKHQDELTAKMHGILIPLIEKIFGLHDTLKNNVLEPSESRLFFEHYIAEQGQFLVALQAYMVKAGLEESMKMMAAMMGGKVDQKEIQAQVDDQVEKLAKLVEEQTNEYVANKVERDAAAFKVLDISGDGKIQKPDVVQALLPNTDKNKEFLNALGVNPEVLAKKLIETQLAGLQQQKGGADAECKQQ